MNKGALHILNELHPDAFESYLDSFPNNRFSGNFTHIFRNNRVGETLAMCMMAEFGILPYELSKLQYDDFINVCIGHISFLYRTGFKTNCGL